jgi:hypothetical protein
MGRTTGGNIIGCWTPLTELVLVLDPFRLTQQLLVIRGTTTFGANMSCIAYKQLVRREVRLQLLLHFTQCLRHRSICP